MQFTMTILAAALASVASSAAIHKRASGSLTLETSGVEGVVYGQLIYAKSSAYIGNIKYSTDAEALLLSGGNGGFSFNSFHSSPTGYQRMIIYPTESKPIGFTVPHSMAVPAGAVTEGFSQDGVSLVYNSEKKWKACPVADAAGTWQIYWDGAATLTECVSVDVAVKDNCAV